MWPAPETGDGEGEGREAVAEFEEGVEVRVETAGAAACLAGEEEVVEFAAFVAGVLGAGERVVGGNG